MTVTVLDKQYVPVAPKLRGEIKLMIFMNNVNE
jgi:hypothetical protein